MPPGDADGPATDETSQLLTFLIADIRGYTTFTQQRGDEAAAQLTAKFAAIVRELVAQYGGSVFELRGDEALCIFTSPRQSLRAAVALQQRFVDEVTADPTLPLAVGVGVDAGEAVHGPDGYRGGALNLAARLCSRAKAGEVVASYEVTHLARAIDGVRYVPGESVALKGLAEPVRLVRVLPVGDDPADAIAAALRGGQVAQSAARSWRTPTRRKVVLATALALALAAGVTVALVVPGGGTGPRLAKFSENAVGIVDPHNGHLTGEVAVDLSPTALVSGLDALWSVNTGANTVSRIDPSSRQVTRTYDVGAAPSAIAIGLGALWVANSGAGTVTRIDPSTGAMQAIHVGSSPGGVAIARGFVWVTNTADATVSRIDPAQNLVSTTIPVGDSPSAIAADRDHVWVANSASNTVSEIDAASATVTQTIHVGNDPRGLAVIDDDVWVANNLDDSIAHIAAGATSVTDTVRLPRGAAPTSVADASGRLWVTLEGTASLAEIDPIARHLNTLIPVGAAPAALAEADGQLWIATTIDPTLHTGGTLKLLAQDLGGTLDPPYLLTAWATWLTSGSYDGLVGFRHANGAAGATLVPDLALAIPEPSNAGRTYTFTLRKHIRWSNGMPVTVRDVERGLLRTIAAGIYGPGAEIVGADGCTPKHCVVPGIVATPRTITINLKRASSDFLDLLAGVVAVPATTPFGDQRMRPIPSTGPYQVTRATAKVVVLTRNRYFHAWYPAAQPAGFPDRIEYRTEPNGDDAKFAANEVAHGRADWTDARGAGSLTSLQAGFGSRLYVSPTETSHGIMLNTRVAPFDDVRVRRALAYAVDRHAVAKDWFTPAVPTCQVIPPNFPGYRPYCPYTSTPDQPGVWQGTLFPKAQRLVDDSHTKGMHVTVLTPPKVAGGMRHVVDVLRDLGYHARLSVYTKDTPDYFTYLADSRHRFQAAFGGWVAGIPNDSDLLRPEFACANFHPADPLNQNIDEFCDPSIDRLMAAADAAENSTSSRAEQKWATVDAKIVDAAPWIGLVTPSWVDAVSKRVHNYVRSAALGVLFDQMWVR